MNEPITISEYASYLKNDLEVLSTHTEALSTHANDPSKLENEKKIDAMVEIITNLIRINKSTLEILESVSRRY